MLKGCSFPGAWKRPRRASEPNPFGIITLTHLGSRWLQGLFLVPGRRKDSLLPETGRGANECDLLAISFVLSLFPPLYDILPGAWGRNLLSRANQHKSCVPSLCHPGFVHLPLCTSSLKSTAGSVPSLKLHYLFFFTHIMTWFVVSDSFFQLRRLN